MNLSCQARRSFLSSTLCSTPFFYVPGLMAEALTQTPKQTEVSLTLSEPTGPAKNPESGLRLEKKKELIKEVRLVNVLPAYDAV